jgi:hypothetical protein
MYHTTVRNHRQKDRSRFVFKHLLHRQVLQQNFRKALRQLLRHKFMHHKIRKLQRKKNTNTPKPQNKGPSRPYVNCVTQNMQPCLSMVPVTKRATSWSTISYRILVRLSPLYGNPSFRKESQFTLGKVKDSESQVVQRYNHMPLGWFTARLQIGKIDHIMP